MCAVCGLLLQRPGTLSTDAGQTLEAEQCGRRAQVLVLLFRHDSSVAFSLVSSSHRCTMSSANWFAMSPPRARIAALTRAIPGVSLCVFAGMRSGYRKLGFLARERLPPLHDDVAVVRATMGAAKPNRLIDSITFLTGSPSFLRGFCAQACSSARSTHTAAGSLSRIGSFGLRLTSSAPFS